MKFHKKSNICHQIFIALLFFYPIKHVRSTINNNKIYRTVEEDTPNQTSHSLSDGKTLKIYTLPNCSSDESLAITSTLRENFTPREIERDLQIHELNSSENDPYTMHLIKEKSSTSDLKTISGEVLGLSMLLLIAVLFSLNLYCFRIILRAVNDNDDTFLETEPLQR